jgi:hypothetical protein
MGRRGAIGGRRWTRMIIDKRGGVKVWCWESHQDFRPRVCVKESWACKLAHWVGVVYVSRRCVLVLVSVRIRCSWSASRRKIVRCGVSPRAKDVHKDKVAMRPSSFLGEKIKLGTCGDKFCLHVCLLVLCDWSVGPTPTGTTPQINSRPPEIRISALVSTRKLFEVYIKFCVSSYQFRWKRGWVCTLALSKTRS